MGLLSNRLEKESLKPGDHIYSWRAAYLYAHHGIYIGDDTVIHFTRRGPEVGTGAVIDVLIDCSVPPTSQLTCPTCKNTNYTHGVIASCLDCFLSGGVLYRFEYSANLAVFLAKTRGHTCTLAASDPPETTLHRANHLLLHNCFGSYNVFKNNCQDFAVYCKTSLLVTDKKPLGQNRQAAGIFGGTLTGVMSVGVKLLNTNIYVKAACSVAVPVATYYADRYATDIGVRSDVVKVAVEDLEKRYNGNHF